MKRIITGSNIVKTFGTGAEQTTALNGVNAEIKEGEFVAVMGPSGSGKSTLLFALSGMDGVTSGSVKYGDTELSRLRENELADVRRTKMGFIFQQPTMLKNLNLLDNILLPAARNGKKEPAKLKQKVKDLMKKTGINGLEYRDAAEVSGGQLQRAGICRALMNAPEILFADEPTGALEIMDLLSAIHKEGMAVLLVTHDAKVASRADRVLFMKDGAIMSELPLHSANDRTEKVNSVMAAMGI